MAPRRTAAHRHSEFSSDRPIASSRADRLNRKPFAESLARRIQAWRGRDSLVLALCGEWGCGKTSLKNMVLERLHRARRHKVQILEFSPWEISGRDSLAAAFFRDLSVPLARSSSEESKRNARVGSLKAYAKVAALGGSALKWVARAVSLADVEAGVVVHVAGETVSQTGEVAEQAAAAHEARNPAAEKSVAELKRELTREMAALENPILVVIDDIDRLTTEEIREVFQLVKANADFPNVTYLLLFDREIVSGALDAVSGERGHEFLDKIVQVLFHVPEPSLKAVHQVLFDGLDAQLREEGVGERFDKSRWSSLWLDGLANYFTNLRHVYRFLGSFSFQVTQMRAGKSFELNPLDLITLEALRLFEPRIYERLHGNRDMLIGGRRSALRDDERQNARSAALVQLLAQIPEARRERTRELLKSLFPRLTGTHNQDSEDWLRDLRVCHEDIFDRYFTLSLSDDDVSQADLDALRTAAGDPAAFVAACESLRARSRLTSAFERLDAYKDVFPTTVFPQFITALCNLGDGFPRNYSSDFFKFDSMIHAWRLIHFGLRRIDDASRRFELLRDGIAASTGVALPVKIASSQERDSSRQEHNYLVDEEHVQALRDIALDRLRAAAGDGRLRDMPGLSGLLYRWREWADDAETRTWVATQLHTAEDALWILRTFLSTVRVESNKVHFIRYINLEDVERFADVARLDALTQPLDLKVIAKESHRALRAFRKALVWRAEGKPAGYYGDTWRENELIDEE